MAFIEMDFASGGSVEPSVISSGGFVNMTSTSSRIVISLPKKPKNIMVWSRQSSTSVGISFLYEENQPTKYSMGRTDASAGYLNGTLATALTGITSSNRMAVLDDGNVGIFSSANAEVFWVAEI